MADYNPDEIDRLVREGREDDEAMNAAPWHEADAISPKILIYSAPGPAPIREVDYLGETYCDQAGQGRRNMKGITRTRNNLAAMVAALSAAKAEVERMTDALTKISAIRDSIVGCQGFNFSEHAYPLVAVLDAAGFRGAGYEIASKNLGTLIERATKAEAEVERLTKEASVIADIVGIDPNEPSEHSVLFECAEHIRSTFDSHRRLALENTRLSARVRELELTEEDREAVEFARERVSFNLNCSVASEYFSDEYADRHRHALAVLDRLVKGGR